MDVYRDPGDTYPRAPATLIADALAAAEHNIMPGFTRESLIQATGLAGDEPDGQQIVARLVVHPGDFGARRAMLAIRDRAPGLLLATNERTANAAQEAVAHALGGVVSRQIIREGDICPRAREVALASTRDDIISPEARAILGSGVERDESDELAAIIGFVIGQGLFGSPPFMHGGQARIRIVFGIPPELFGPESGDQNH